MKEKQAMSAIGIRLGAGVAVGALAVLAGAPALSQAQAAEGVQPFANVAEFLTGCADEARAADCAGLIKNADAKLSALRGCRHASDAGGALAPVVGWLAERPQTHGLPAGDGVLLALSNVFSCKDSARGDSVAAFAWPVCGTPGRGMGYEMRAGGRRVELHRGLDLGNRDAIPVRAGAAGHVSASETRKGYGLTVEIAHAGGYRTLYANLKSSGVSAGESVGRGQVIGATGTSGAPGEAKLHFEVLKGERVLDPMRHLEKDEACTAP
jgi:murein DD-endopeptidase MepM/ murein hydrolase activator NlpD